MSLIAQYNEKKAKKNQFIKNIPSFIFEKKKAGSDEKTISSEIFANSYDIGITYKSSKEISSLVLRALKEMKDDDKKNEISIKKYLVNYIEKNHSSFEILKQLKEN